MKSLSFNISNEYSKKIFFPEERIKDKIKIIEILLEACRFILFQDETNFNSANSSQLILIIDKMSRLIFISENKYYSIVFPFSFHKENNEKIISYKNIFNIDSKTISDLLSIFKHDNFNSTNFLDFADSFTEFDEDIWILIKLLLSSEDGYLRFDYDKKGYEIAKAKKKEHTHPLNHLDFFYTSASTFKFGLRTKISSATFIDFLDLKTDCFYLNK